MTTLTEIVNRALQVTGTRTSVTDAELATNSTNEAIQANLVLDNIRRRLLRMAPWDCSLRTANLVYISSVPGTPENVNAPSSALWQPGIPTPPWAYEYQYPVDCLRACWIIPGAQTGFSGGVPITTAVTGGAPSFWQGPPVRFNVQTDRFCPVTAATVASGGSGYAVGDIITAVSGVNTNPPIGAPVQLLVTAAPGGVISTVSVIKVIPGDAVIGGSYFTVQTNPVAQGSTTGSGTGATFNLTQSSVQIPQRVVLCNQEFATLVYCQDVLDPNIMDDMFQDAYTKILGATLCIPLTGDKKLAQLAVQEANVSIMLARQADGNEGLTINDHTPDWIRVRGADFANAPSSPYAAFDWGSLWPSIG